MAVVMLTQVQLAEGKPRRANRKEYFSPFLTCNLPLACSIFRAQNVARWENKNVICIVPPLQYSCLENPMDGGAWWAAVHGVAKSRTRLSDFTFTFHFHALGPSSPAWPRDQSRDLSPNASGGLTPLSPPSELQEIPVAIREQSGVLCFHSR